MRVVCDPGGRNEIPGESLKDGLAREIPGSLPGRLFIIETGSVVLDVKNKGNRTVFA